jgi:hypothetical protein
LVSNDDPPSGSVAAAQDVILGVLAGTRRTSTQIISLATFGTQAGAGPLAILSPRDGLHPNVVKW